VTEVVGPDHDAWARQTTIPRKTAEVAGVLAVGPVEPARTRFYRFVYWGAFRARFSPYFLRSFIRASRVSSPAFFSAARKSGS